MTTELPITIHKDAEGIVWLRFKGNGQHAALNINHIADNHASKFIGGVINEAITAYPANKQAEQAEGPSLYDEVMSLSIYDCKKHNLAPDADEHAERQFNRLTPAEQLREISNALERMAGK